MPVGNWIDLVVESLDGPQRADIWIAQELEESRSFVKKLFDQKLVVTSGGQPLKPATIVEPGLGINVFIPDPKPLHLEPKDLNIPIIFEDDHLAVVVKPAGIATHPAPTYHGDTLVQGLMYQLKNLSSIGGTIRPGIVHRLDEPVSGVLVVAKNDQAHQGLSQLFAQHDLVREYVAVGLTTQKLLWQEKTIRTQIGRHPQHRQKMAVLPNGGKTAISHFTVVSQQPGRVHLKVKLETGRTHQIRVHCAHLGLPLAGDRIYGKSDDSLDRILLHAHRLAFAHPITGEFLNFFHPPPWEVSDANF